MKKLLVLFMMPLLAFAQDAGWLTYNTSGKKDIGLNALIAYPTGFTINEDNPAFLAKFTKRFDGMSVYLTIAGRKISSRRKITNEMLSDVTDRELFQAAEKITKEMFGAKHGFRAPRSTTVTKIAIYPAIIFDISSDFETASKSRRYARHEIATVFTRKHFVSMSCSIGGDAENEANIDKAFSLIRESVCHRYFSTLVMGDDFK